MTKTKVFAGAGITVVAALVVGSLAVGQSAPSKTIVGTSQVANPISTFTAFEMRTDTGKQLYRPAADGSIVIDDVARTIKAVTTAPPPPVVPTDQTPIVVSVLDPTVPANRSFLVPAIPAPNSLVVSRNGLENYEAIDYTSTVSGPASVTVTYPAGSLELGDTIAIRYKK